APETLRVVAVIPLAANGPVNVPKLLVRLLTVAPLDTESVLDDSAPENIPIPEFKMFAIMVLVVVAPVTVRVVAVIPFAASGPVNVPVLVAMLPTVAPLDTESVLEDSAPENMPAEEFRVLDTMVLALVAPVTVRVAAVKPFAA